MGPILAAVVLLWKVNKSYTQFYRNEIKKRKIIVYKSDFRLSLTKLF
jgi:hypothetical protein